MISHFLPTNQAFHEPFSRKLFEHGATSLDWDQSQDQHHDSSADTSRARITTPRLKPLGLSFTSADYSGLNISTDDAMQSDQWITAAPWAPKADQMPRNRQSSLSSLGSPGPASPYANLVTNPKIANTDSILEGFGELSPNDGSGAQGVTFVPPTKPIGSYLSFSDFDPAISEKMAYPVPVPNPNSKPRTDHLLLPAPGFHKSRNPSRPASVTSSAAGESPATPIAADSEQVERRRTGRYLTSSEGATATSDYCHVPKLDRTMTDVYSDELYSPNFAITSTPPSQSQTFTSPTNDLFSQRIHTANINHLSATHSPSFTETRTRSPFRTGSAFIPVPNFGLEPPDSSARTDTERARSQRVPSLQDGEVQTVENKSSVESPETISPKDAMLEFGDTDGTSNFPLFPQEAPLPFAVPPNPSGIALPSDTPRAGRSDMSSTGSALVPAADLSSIEALPSQPTLGSDIMGQQQPLVPTSSPSDTASTHSLNSKMSTTTRKPSGVGSDAGTYTCTYHGCMHRFETPTLLQKHKREGHRQMPGVNGPRDTNISAGMLNTQSGPHRCDRINPSTGKSCNTVFSRPYDLTRHEDTIHNARKQKVRCDMCTEEKTFSRADALTRHYRVCHPEAEVPGKHRRQGSV